MTEASVAYAFPPKGLLHRLTLRGETRASAGQRKSGTLRKRSDQACARACKLGPALLALPGATKPASLLKANRLHLQTRQNTPRAMTRA